MYADTQTYTIEIQVTRITAQSCLSLELQRVPPHLSLTPWLHMLPSASLPSDTLPTAPPQPELEAEHWLNVRTCIWVPALSLTSCPGLLALWVSVSL